jgi:hypothetical protein
MGIGIMQHLPCDMERIRLNAISNTQLEQLISTQYNLPLVAQHQLDEARNKCLPFMAKKTMQWLLKHNVSPVKVDDVGKMLTVAIDDPTNEHLLGKIINYLQPYKTQFMLIKRDEIRVNASYD